MNLIPPNFTAQICFWKCNKVADQCVCFSNKNYNHIETVLKYLKDAEKVTMSAINFREAAEEYLSETDYDLNFAIGGNDAEIFVSGMDALWGIRAAIKILEENPTLYK